MYNRYINRPIRINDLEFYKEFLEQRKIRQLTQYLTPIIPELTSQRKRSLDTTKHIWKAGDKLYKLASTHYGDPTLWWLIAWYNEKPTEAHFDLGDVVYIPLPLGRILSYYNNHARK